MIKYDTARRKKCKAINRFLFLFTFQQLHINTSSSAGYSYFSTDTADLEVKYYRHAANTNKPSGELTTAQDGTGGKETSTHAFTQRRFTDYHNYPLVPCVCLLLRFVLKSWGYFKRLHRFSQNIQNPNSLQLFCCNKKEREKGFMLFPHIQGRSIYTHSNRSLRTLFATTTWQQRFCNNRRNDCDRWIWNIMLSINSR